MRDNLYMQKTKLGNIDWIEIERTEGLNPEVVYTKSDRDLNPPLPYILVSQDTGQHGYLSIIATSRKVID